MEKYQHGFAIICSVILFLGLVAFTACVAAEFKRTKAKEVKLVGKLCYLSGSPAFGLGITALICLLAVQIVGISVIGRQFCSRGQEAGGESKKQSLAIYLLVLSWISFGFAIILLGAATSMNQRQPYGKGWLEGECYVVKDGVYIGSAVLVLSTLIFSLGSIWATRARYCRKQVEQGRKVHAGVW